MIKPIVAAVLLASACLVILFLWDRPGIVLPTVKPGQVWLYQSRDPFNKRYRTNTVIEVRDGYVRFNSVSVCDGDVFAYENSESIEWFVTGSTLLKP